MPRPLPGFRPALALLALPLLAVAPPGGVSAQSTAQSTAQSAAPTAAPTTGSPLVPRGSILFEAGGIFTQVAETFGADGRRGVGADAFQANLTASRFPALEREQASLRALLADPGAELLGGTFRSRLEVNDQQAPLRLGYGILDRLSVAVTVPLVRRRVDAHLQRSEASANVGENPARDGATASSVVAFRENAEAARQALQSSVASSCADDGAGTEACLAGQALEAELQAFLGALDEAWDELDLFPRAGSAAGDALRARWADTREALLGGWGVEGPETLPLATSSAAGFFQGALSDPVWDADGFPNAQGESVLRLGDVEIHAAVGLLDWGASAAGDADAPAGFRVRSALEGTLRLGTGEVDSFSVLTPLAPLTGHGGFGARWVTDLVAGRRAGLLVEAQWQTFSEGSGLLLAFDPVNGWNPERARVTASGAPGDRFRLSLTPRIALVPGLSLGGGVQLVRTGEARWVTTGGPGSEPNPDDVPDGEPAADVPPGVERIVPSWSTSQIVAELRLSGWSSPLSERLPFPLEIAVRGIRSVQGSGDAPVESRLEANVRVLRRR